LGLPAGPSPELPNAPGPLRGVDREAGRQEVLDGREYFLTAYHTLVEDGYSCRDYQGGAGPVRDGGPQGAESEFGYVHDVDFLERTLIKLDLGLIDFNSDVTAYGDVYGTDGDFPRKLNGYAKNQEYDVSNGITCKKHGAHTGRQSGEILAVGDDVNVPEPSNLRIASSGGTTMAEPTMT